jgi:hypothetical protein
MGENSRVMIFGDEQQKGCTGHAQQATNQGKNDDPG